MYKKINITPVGTGIEQTKEREECWFVLADYKSTEKKNLIFLATFRKISLYDEDLLCSKRLG